MITISYKIKKIVAKVTSFLILYLFICIIFTLTIYLAWYINPLFACIAFIPFYYVIDTENYNKWQKRLLIFSLLFLYNLSITYWLLVIDTTNGWLPIFANSIYLYLAYPFSKIINFLLKNKCTSFIVSFLLIEWLHFNWIFAWPWLTIGNVFGSKPIYIQWYQYTTVLGGSFWILIVNLLIQKKANLKLTKSCWIF